MPSYQVRLTSSIQPQVYKDDANNILDAGYNGPGWYLDDDAPYKMRGQVVETFTGEYEIYKPDWVALTIPANSSSQYLPSSDPANNPMDVVFLRNLGNCTIYVSIDSGVRFPIMIKENEAWGCRIVDPQTVKVKTLEPAGGLVGRVGMLLAYIDPGTP